MTILEQPTGISKGDNSFGSHFFTKSTEEIPQKLRKSDIKLGILVPTRNREEYLVHSLASATKFRSECSFSVDIFVANNGDRELPVQLLSRMQEQGIESLPRPTHVLSMSQNWNQAYEKIRLTNVTHLLILGDDDFLLSPNYGEFEDSFLSGSDAVHCDRHARQYFWPSNSSEGRVVFHRATKPVYPDQMRNDPTAMFRNPRRYQMAPCPYQGFISVQALDKVVEEFGVLSPARSPDVFLSFVLASDSSLRSSYLTRPFLCEGVSPKSNGASSLGLSKNDDPFKDFSRLSTNEIPPNSSLPGLESFPSLFIATTEVYDWVRLKRSGIPPLNVVTLVQGVAETIPLAKPAEVTKLKTLADSLGVRLPTAATHVHGVENPGFQIFGNGFSSTCSMQPHQVVELFERKTAAAKFLLTSIPVLFRSAPSILRRLTDKLKKELRSESRARV
jgi:glycosyltransferase involved in cell wall biosynthesis